jgi:phospholipase C
MSGTGRPEQTADDGITLDAEPALDARPALKPACVALVPMVTSAQWSQIPSQQLSRSNSTFVTHLIAAAEHVPQTRSVRRATAADAQTAYSANQHRVQGAGMRARQII